MSNQTPIQTHKNVAGRKFRGLPMHAAAGLHEAVMERIAAAGTAQGARVLELGCGSGAFTQRLTESGFDVTAVDIALDSYGASATALQIDLNQDFAGLLSGREFDLIVALEVIEHLENPQHFLRQAARLMTAETALWVSFPNMYLYLAALSFLRDASFVNWNVHQYWSMGHQSLLSDWLFEQHAIKAGLRIDATHFVAPIALEKAHPSVVKRMASRAALGVLRMMTPDISREQRLADCVLFKLTGAGVQEQTSPPTGRD